MKTAGAMISMTDRQDDTLARLDGSIHEFDASRFGTLEMLKQQTPTSEGWRAAIVACSETAFMPDQTSFFELGELLVVQNFGNVITPASENPDEGTEVTDLVRRKGVQHVIVCGHLKCRTIGHFTQDGERNATWLNHGNRLRELVRSHYSMVPETTMLNVAAQENVLLQLEKELQSLANQRVDAHVYGWILDDESQRVHCYDPVLQQFQILGQ